jgi:predicted ATPase
MSGKTARHIPNFPSEAKRRCARPSTALVDRAAASALDGWVFVDRGLIDAAANLQFMTGEPVLATLGQSHRYHRRVFLTPPWPEIYSTDPERCCRGSLDHPTRSLARVFCLRVNCS